MFGLSQWIQLEYQYSTAYWGVLYPLTKDCFTKGWALFVTVLLQVWGGIAIGFIHMDLCKSNHIYLPLHSQKGSFNVR